MTVPGIEQPEVLDGLRATIKSCENIKAKNLYEL